MIDTKQVNLLDLIGRDVKLKRAASTNGGEYHSSCPFCGGVDRFAVQPNGKGWSCRQCTPSWQDAIEYVKRRDGVGFKAAVEILGLPLDSQPFNKRQHRTIDPNDPQSLGQDYIALNDPDWQEHARRFCEASFDALWSGAGRKALDYLLQRGISERVLEAAGVGYNAEETRPMWGLTEVWLPRGIVIPWTYEGKFWKVNIRRPSGEPKYIQPKGGANGLYNASAIQADTTVVMVEGEFDCLVLQSFVPGIVPVATGTTSGARILRWVSLVGMASKIVLAFDVDENGAGDKAAAWWLEQLGESAVRVPPTAHDVTDMFRAGHDLWTWLEPYSLYDNRESTVEELDYRKGIRAEMERIGYTLVEVV